ncbi:MAG: DNA primase [Candidatus Moranbacteria bacterium]|nr:DNA primase [Candidatus Moranbacteria bacterium]
MDSIVPEIKSKLNIVDVVGSYLRLTKAGAYWKACCPFHNEKTPSFTVNEERQAFHCFGCGKGGDIFSFVEEIEGIEFREALKLLAERAGVEVPAYRKSSVFSKDGVEEPDRTREILELSTKFFEKQLWEGEGAKTALPYLRKRGLSDESIKTFRVGYSLSGWRHLHDFLVSRGYRPEELERAGLVIAKDGRTGYYDRFRDRIMFPISDVVGRVIGYSARVAPGGDESQAKYINTPETPVYHKGRVLYGLYQAKQAIKAEGVSVLVEGQMDVIACHQAGIKNAIAASGTALTGEQLDILKRYGREIRLFFDMDGAGQAAAWKSALLSLGKEMSVSVVLLPEGKDAADAALEDPEALRQAVIRSTPAAKYFLNRAVAANDVRIPEGKRSVAEGYAPLLAAMTNRIDRDFWQRELADAIGVEERSLLATLRAAEAAPRESAPEIPKAKSSGERGDVFLTRSGVLCDRILGLMLLEPAFRKDSRILGRVEEALFSDPLFLLIRSASPDDLFPVSEDEETKRRLARSLFDAEELLVGERGEDEQDKRKEVVFSELLGQLSEEFRKEELQRIVKAIGAARADGDRALEKKLLERFAELSREN